MSIPPWELEQEETIVRESKPWPWWVRNSPMPDFPGFMRPPNEFRTRVPPYHAGPNPDRPTMIADHHNIFWVDPDGNYIGWGEGNWTPWGSGGPLGRMILAGRTDGTRGL
jgi:hypothetical protein